LNELFPTHPLSDIIAAVKKSELNLEVAVTILLEQEKKIKPENKPPINNNNAVEQIDVPKQSSPAKERSSPEKNPPSKEEEEEKGDSREKAIEEVLVYPERF
jgi:hypothetical protein